MFRATCEIQSENAQSWTHIVKGLLTNLYSKEIKAFSLTTDFLRLHSKISCIL